MHLQVGQRQLHLLGSEMLAETFFLQAVQHIVPRALHHLVGFAEFPLKHVQGVSQIIHIQIGLQPTLHVLAAAVAVEALVLAVFIWAHGNLDGLAGTGEERYRVEAYLCLFGKEHLTDGIAGLELLLERAVGSNVEHQRICIFLKHVLIKALHGGEAELLGIVALEASADGDGVGLEPVFRNGVWIGIR